MTSVIRALAAYAAGAVLALPAAPAVEAALGIDESTAQAALTAGVVLVLGVAAHALERWWTGKRAAPPRVATDVFAMLQGIQIEDDRSPPVSAAALVRQLGDVDLVDGEPRP